MKMVTQSADATAAKRSSRWNSIWATPATNGASVRTTGRNLASTIAMPPCRS